MTMTKTEGPDVVMDEDLIDFDNLPPVVPRPALYHILVAIPKLEERTKGGIIKPDLLLDKEQMASMAGMVIALGPEAYQDKKRFPNGPACKKGDWVVFRAYAGTRFKIQGTEFRLVPDDSIQATVEDPRFIRSV